MTVINFHLFYFYIFHQIVQFVIQIRCFVDVFFSFLFQLEYNFTLLGALVSIGGDLLLEVLLVLLVETDQIELLAGCCRLLNGIVSF